MRTKTLEQNSAQDFAGLQVDLLQKMRNGSMSYEQVKWFNNLSFEQREKLMGRLSTKIVEHYKMKLIDSNIVATGLVGEFNPQQYFAENKNVKYWRDDNFNTHVLNQAKTINGFPDMSFSKRQFIGTINDKEIMEHFQISESAGLMIREEILWTIASLTSKQPKGESGALLNNGYATIIGYMLCNDGIVRGVDVYWHPGVAMWNCGCRDLGARRAGREVLSRNKKIK